MAGMDLGTDTGSVAINLGTKFGEAILKLLEKIFQAWKDAPHRKLEKQKLTEAKDHADKIKLIKKMDKRSEISLNKLKQVARAKGDSTIATGIEFKTENDMKEFSAHAKIQGLLFSGVYQKDGLYHIHTLTQDVPNVKRIVDRITDDKRIQSIDNSIEKILSKGELSEQDKANLESLQKTKREIQDKYSFTINQESFDNIIDDVINDRPFNAKGLQFDYKEFNDGDKESTLAQALDRCTNGELTKNTEIYVVDATEPNRYVVARGEIDTFNKEDYIKTTYEVHNSNGEQKEFNDGRFENRPKDYWKNTKNDMVQFGGFQNNSRLFRFSAKDEFERWSELTKAQNENENIRKAKVSEYAETIEAKKIELKDKGYDIDDQGKVIFDKDLEVKRKKEMFNLKGEEAKFVVKEFSKKIGKDEVLNATEAIIIGKEIQNYEALLKNSEDLSMAKANELIASTDEEKAEASKIVGGFEEERSNLETIEEQLIEERKAVNGCQAKEEQAEEFKRDNIISFRRKDREAERGNGEHDQHDTMENYEGKIQAMREDEAKISHGEERHTDKSNETKQGSEKGTKTTSKSSRNDGR